VNAATSEGAQNEGDEDVTDSQSTDSPTTEGPAPAPAGSTAAPAPAGHANMLNLKLKVWRQAGPDVHGHFEDYTTTVADDASFLEMLDYVNEDLINGGDEPISFDHDCREGICGTCGVMIDGQAHGPQKGTATCQLHMRMFNDGDSLNQSLEKAGRVADFLELGELMCRDALHRTESCGGHFREESQTPEGEAKRDDENFTYVAAWQWRGEGNEPALHKEPLTFDYVKPSQRSYK